jgi:signal transduction histidine kinase
MSHLTRIALGAALLLALAGGPLWLLLHDAMVMVRREAWLIAGAILLVAATALTYARIFTGRLKRLVAAMEQFRASGFVRRPDLSRDTAWTDELGHLTRDLEALAARMVEQLNDARQADADRRELIANISHDLRTPLASLRGYLDTLLIQDDALTCQQRQTYLGVAVEQSERLTRLVADLFDMAKLDAPNATLAREPCALGELMQDVAQKFELPARARGVGLRTEIAPDAPWVEADIAAMERVLSNLVDNAMRHTPANGTVTLALIPLGKRLRAEVRDTGSGLSEAEQAKVFERFWRADASRSSAGAGLGLAIGRRIVELHGGSLEVQSTPGRGACFSFELPVHTMQR